jgi:hypothetical protein
MADELKIGDRLYKESVRGKQTGDKILDSLQKSLSRLNRKASREATRLYKSVFRQLTLRGGLIENTVENLSLVGRITSGLEPITDAYRIAYAQMIRDYREEMFATLSNREAKIGGHLEKIGMQENRDTLTQEAFTQMSILEEKNFRKINAMLLKWKDTAYDLFINGVTRGMTLINFRDSFYNDSGTVKIGSSLEQMSTAEAMQSITEQRTAFVRQKAKENGYTYCWNANPMDPLTKPICLEASLAGVIPEADMSKEFGFPPRYVCRCEVVYTNPNWIGVNQGVNQAIRERRKALISALENAPRQKSYWYWTDPYGKRKRVWSDDPTKGDKMYKETADKLKLVNSKTVPDFKKGRGPKGGPPAGPAPIPPPVPAPPTVGQIRRFGADIKSVALESESGTTRVLKNIADANAGVKMEGLAFRIKSSKSMLRKMRKELDDNPKWLLKDLADEDVNDILRYTMLVDEAKYTGITSNTLTTLVDQGHEVLLVKNYWDSPGYKGINTVLRNPQGAKYELQFHTPKSIHVKEKISHPLYEKIRASKDPVKVKKWTKEMDEAWESVALPEGVLGISKEVMTKKPIPSAGITNYQGLSKSVQKEFDIALKEMADKYGPVERIVAEVVPTVTENSVGSTIGQSIFINTKWVSKIDDFPKTYPSSGSAISDLTRRIERRKAKGFTAATDQRLAAYEETLLELKEKGDDVGRFVFAAGDEYSPRDLIIHEYGHVADNKVTAKLLEDVDIYDIDAQRKAIKSYDEAKSKTFGTYVSKSKGKISDYSMENPQEYFAEAWSAYHSDKRRLLDKEVIEFFEKEVIPVIGE